MSFTARVENDVIKLPVGMHLPDGTTVTVIPPESVPSPAGGESLSAFLEKFAGCVDTGHGDVAENHDHYAHGTPKGIDRR